jgi:hypothetical protein
MAGHTMLMDHQNQYCENGYTVKSNLYVNALSNKISVTFFTELKNSILKFIWKHKSSQIVKRNPEEKEQHWRYQDT